MVAVVTHLRPSRWDRSPESLTKGLDKSFRQGAHVILLTEVADGKRPEALRNWAKANGFGLAQDTIPWQSGEVAALWDIQEARLLGWDTISIGPDLGPGLPLVAVFVVLEFENKTVGMFSTSHLPSAVEGTWFAKGRRIVEYGKATLRYRRAASLMRKKYRPDFELLAADWNLDVLKKWVRNYLKTTFPKHALVVANGGGTHGNRQIDAALVRFRKSFRGNSGVSSHVLELDKSSDHRGVEVVSIVGKSRT